MNTTALSLVFGILIVAVVLWIRFARSRSRDLTLCEQFGLDPAEYELVGSDLGGSDDKVWLRTGQLIGVPDAVFRHRRGLEIVIGEVKSRYYRGAIKKYEHFQVVLYLGVAESVYRKPTRGVLKYGCGKLVPVEYSPDLYSYLLSLIPTFRRIQSKISSS